MIQAGQEAAQPVTPRLKLPADGQSQKRDIREGLKDRTRLQNC
jgi:hypothetical protein